MDHNKQFTMPLEELCARTIQAGHQLAREFPCAEVARDAREAGFIRRTLDQLNGRDPMSGAHDGGLSALSATLDRELEAETLEWRTEFDGHNDPEFGAVGSVREVRVLTDRGHTIEEAARRLRAYQEMRDICRARMEAERLLFRGMSR